LCFSELSFDQGRQEVIESNYPTDEVIRRNNPEDNNFSGRAYPEDRDVMRRNNPEDNNFSGRGYPEDRDVMRRNDGEVMRRNTDDVMRRTSDDVMRRNDGDDFTRGHFPEDRDVISRNDVDRDVTGRPFNRQSSFVGRNERTGCKLLYQYCDIG
jgi:hypothetical protein